MVMKKRIPIACLIASLFVLAAGSASAEETDAAKKDKAKPAAAAVQDKKDEKGYGYAFEDDPLQSGVAGTMGFVLKVRPKGAREVLLRPRTSFVPEMLKSVEAL
jgi:hypothetical protein